MITRILIILCCVSFLKYVVYAEEDDVKKGHYPFMAFIYYPDETIVDVSGPRFLRGAVLVKPDWLITSNIGPVLTNVTPTGFPRKTLLARVGAISIDVNLTLNEDDDEQEREIVQLIRPRNFSESKWWRNDITLLKTLLPFNMTTAVSTSSIRTKPGINKNSNCFMLIYAVTKSLGNWSEDRMLMPLSVELQTSRESCGNHFYEATMMCALDSEDIKNADYDPDFCLGNSGGPLVCDNEVTGLQTYIDNNCRPPFLYQLLSAWDNFITCGIEDKCAEEQCRNMCMVINKDDQVTQKATVLEEQHKFYLASAGVTTVTKQSDEPTKLSSVTTIANKLYKNTTTQGTTATKHAIPKDSTGTSKKVTNTPIVTTKGMKDQTTQVITETIRYEDTEITPFTVNQNSTPSKTLDNNNSSNFRVEDNTKIERKTNVEPQQLLNKGKKRNSAEQQIAVPIFLLLQLTVVFSVD